MLTNLCSTALKQPKEQGEGNNGPMRERKTSPKRDQDLVLHLWAHGGTVAIRTQILSAPRGALGSRRVLDRPAPSKHASHHGLAPPIAFVPCLDGQGPQGQGSKGSKGSGSIFLESVVGKSNRRTKENAELRTNTQSIVNDLPHWMRPGLGVPRGKRRRNT